MLDVLTIVVYVLGRYLHIVAMTLLVGGTLFYLWVVPVAIAELKEESKLAVFARARWVFRWIVFASAITLLLTGAVLTARSMWIYKGEQLPLYRQIAKFSNPKAPHMAVLDQPTVFQRPAVWFVLHVSVGTPAILIAVSLVRGGRPPYSPLPWMRLNFVLLMIAILLACMTRNARMLQFESVRPVGRELPPETRD